MAAKVAWPSRSRSGSAAITVAGTVRSLFDLRAASTAIASSAPLPHTPQEDVV